MYQSSINANQVITKNQVVTALTLLKKLLHII